MNQHQHDWIGGPQTDEKPFKDIRNQRSTVAEEKARLCLELGVLINRVPQSVRNGSVNITRQWRADRDKAAKVAASSRSSVQELNSAINSMTRYERI